MFAVSRDTRFVFSVSCDTRLVPSQVPCSYGCKDSNGKAIDWRLCSLHSSTACCHNKLWSSCAMCSGTLTCDSCTCIHLHQETHFGGTGDEAEYEVHSLLGVRAFPGPRLQIKVKWRNGVETWEDKSVFDSGNCVTLLRKLLYRLRMDYRTSPSLAGLLWQLGRICK